MTTTLRTIFRRFLICCETSPLLIWPLNCSRFGSIALFQPWFPETNPKHPRAWTWRKKLSDRDTTLLTQIFVSAFIFIFNFGVTLYATTNYNRTDDMGDLLGPEDGITCSGVKSYNLWLHLSINALSTMLISASNYCAQILIAPTRQDVDAAHMKHEWYDIGVQSWRNLKKTNKRKKCTWAILMASSALLHLTYASHRAFL